MAQVSEKIWHNTCYSGLAGSHHTSIKHPDQSAVSKQSFVRCSTASGNRSASQQLKIACLNRPSSTSQKKTNVNVQRKLRIMSSGVLAGKKDESILASSEYGDDGIIPAAMKKWLNKSDTGLNY